MEMIDLDALVVERNRLKREVQDWMTREGLEGRLRTNSQAPAWADYVKAEDRLEQAKAALGRP